MRPPCLFTYPTRRETSSSVAPGPEAEDGPESPASPVIGSRPARMLASMRLHGIMPKAPSCGALASLLAL